MKDNFGRIFICCCLFFFLGIGNTFSQLRWDSIPGKFEEPDAAQVMYADSNYMYVAGDFYEVGGIPIKGIARWNGVKWDSMGAGVNGLDIGNQYGLGDLATITTFHNRIYVGGAFFSLGHVNARAIGTWDGTKWDSLPIQPIGQLDYDGIATLDVINDKLYIGGYFDTVAGFPCTGIASWDGTKWSSLNFPSNFSFNGIGAICEYKGSIYAGGYFDGENGTVGGILRLDSTGWHSVDTGIKGSGWIGSMLVYKGELYVAGLFSKSNGNADNNIQRWNGTSWNAVGGGTDYEIWNLMVYNDKLYAMGQLSEAGGIYTSSIAEWDGNKWCSLGSTFDNDIETSCVYKDSLYIGGGFWTIDGDSISYIAEWTGGSYVANCGQPTGVTQLKMNDEQLKIYPNPNNGQFTLSLSNVTENCNVEIYNMLGEKVYSQLTNNNSQLTINLSGQAQGVYLYRVISDNGDLVGEGKLVIAK